MSSGLASARRCSRRRTRRLSCRTQSSSRGTSSPTRCSFARSCSRSSTQQPPSISSAWRSSQTAPSRSRLSTRRSPRYSSISPTTIWRRPTTASALRCVRAWRVSSRCSCRIVVAPFWMQSSIGLRWHSGPGSRWRATGTSSRSIRPRPSPTALSLSASTRSPGALATLSRGSSRSPRGSSSKR
eukprot:Amastigsp_a676933_13.p2 type:complete len:184 gc:universal Amastigsp_a676933_13:1208-657(-)